MTHKTPADFALWAALPMAHTSKIEERIKMVLDTTRRRTSPRRFLLIASLAGAAALVPLSMLQPTAKAQTASVPAQAAIEDIRGIQILGITNAALPGSDWWSKNGETLPTPVFDWDKQFSGRTTTAKPGQKALVIALRLPPSLQNKPLSCDISGTTRDGVTIDSPGHTINAQSMQYQMHNGQTAYEAAFPMSLAKTDVQIGVASGVGTETVNCPKTAGKVRFQRPSGEVIFTLIPNPHHLPAAEAALGHAVFMVSDHFRSPSPLAHSSMQTAEFDGMNYERSVYALDSAGQVVTKLNIAARTSPDASSEASPDFYTSAKTEQLTEIPNSLLKRVASFRLVARPFQWIEFKDVALQPIKL
jgi:hypothetical protein